jgi:hypothetical protein
MALSDKELDSTSHKHTFVFQANSYKCSKLTLEDGQGTPDTCRVAKIK